MAQPTGKGHPTHDQEMTDAENAIAENLGGTEIIRTVDMGLNRTEFANVGSFAEAIEMLGGLGNIDEATADLVGDGSIRLDKDELIGVPFLVTSFDDKESDEYEGSFLLIRGITQSGTKFFITDGSRDAGLRVDLLRYRERTGKSHIFCPRGLQMSTYTIKEGEEKGKTGKTYFIDTRKSRV